MKKGNKILIIIVAVILAAYALAVVSKPIVYSEFYKASQKFVNIPGLKENFVPQGVSRLEKEGITLICGYMTGDQNSRLYLIYDNDKDNPKFINLLREDGSVYTGHAGGVSANGDYVYISNQSKIFVLSKEEAINANAGDSVSFLGYFDVPSRSSFCSCDGKYLYVGEYFAEGYETDETHSMATSDGENNALLFAYEISEGSEYNIKDTDSPSFAISLPDKVQGFAVKNSAHAFVSCSEGLHESHLYEYDLSKAPEETIVIGENTLKAKVLDSSSLSKETRLPRMSEDLEIIDDNSLLVGFESGAKKFGYGLIPFTVREVRILSVE